MIHEEAQELLAAGAALDDLEPAERAEYEAHLVDCGDCARLEDELASVLADLSLIVPERIPPADLYAGIRSVIAAEGRTGTHALPPARPTAAPLTPAAGAPAGTVISLEAARRSRRLARAAMGIAAVLAFATVGLGARSIGLQQDLDRSSAQVAALRTVLQDQRGVLAAAVDPRQVTVALASEELAGGATAVVVFIPGTTSSYIVADKLPPTPSGHGYQLWFADETGVHPLQTVPFDGNGAFVGPLDVDLAAGTAVMITLEETGGSQGEPGPQVVYGEL